MKKVIEVEDVFFSYEDRSILSEISFVIEENSFTGIIGPNGGGKTTLLKILMGFLKPNRGRVLINNQPPKTARKDISWVPQNLRFDRAFPITLLELVLGGRISKAPLFGNFRKEDKEAALEAIDLVGLSEFKNLAFAYLSGGQIQRALIARALASHPKILFLDEPTANVDVQAENQIYDILSSLKGKMTILMVTHDFKAIVNQVDKVLCVQKTATLMDPEKVCGHFALNLYHNPLIN